MRASKLAKNGGWEIAAENRQRTNRLHQAA